MILIPQWPAPPGVRAAFTLRTGGVSHAPFDSFNLGLHAGDCADSVGENRRALARQLGLGHEPAWLRQVHGSRVVRLDADPSRAMDPEPRADASVTSGEQVCVVLVADCMPVLLAARDGSVVGAAHAGWRGMAAGVLAATVRELNVPPGELIAWMGPAIGAAHFEVGEEVRTAFVTHDPDTAAAFVPNAGGRWLCDLYGIARHQLTALGLAGVYGGGWCTFADRARFFSFRRDGSCGRMAALIWRAAGASQSPC